MKIFISSVRRGLETERDALRGLIAAVGHTPAQFEDFTAKPVPSREACLMAVSESDVYILLIGPHYGQVFPETGKSATHEEWVAAGVKGIPRLVFRKRDVPLDREQAEFLREVGAYGTGVFYAEFADATELQTQVVRALRELEQKPSALEFLPLQTPVEVEWRASRAPGWGGSSPDPWLEVHVVPLTPTTLPARQLRELPDQVVTELRSGGVLPTAAGAAAGLVGDAALVELPGTPRRWRDMRTGELRGVRVDTRGQISLWWSPPGDGMGAILDIDKLVALVTSGLRLAGAMGLTPDDGCAISIGLGGDHLLLASEGKVTGVARSSAEMSPRTQPVQVHPDEGVSTAALNTGAEEVARSLVLSLLERFRDAR